MWGWACKWACPSNVGLNKWAEASSGPWLSSCPRTSSSSSLPLLHNDSSRKPLAAMTRQSSDAASALARQQRLGLPTPRWCSKGDASPTFSLTRTAATLGEKRRLDGGSPQQRGGNGNQMPLWQNDRLRSSFVETLRRLRQRRSDSSRLLDSVQQGKTPDSTAML